MLPLSQLLTRAFDIKKNELSIAIWMQLYLFLLICALLVVKPTVNALFLSVAGRDNLSIAFVITALVAVIVSYTYNRLLVTLPLHEITKNSLWFFGAVFVLIGGLVVFDFENIFLSYVFYIFIGIYAILATSQFWVTANIVFNVSQAKRLFGFVGAGGIAGGIAGGYLTSITAPYINNGFLIATAGLMILACVFIYKKVRSLRIVNLKNIKLQKQERVSKKKSLSLIIKNSHLSYLAGVIGLGVVVAKLVDYQFSYLSSVSIPEPDDLASFFGFWFSTFNIISLLIQLFLTKKFLENLNISSNLLVLPSMIVICTSLLFIFPELWVVVLLKGFDGSLKQSLYKSSVELLALPVPSEIKNKTKTFIDVVVDSTATGIAGLLIILIIKGLELPTYTINFIIIIATLFWMYMILKVRSTYLSTFKSSISIKTGLFDKRSNLKVIRENIKVIIDNGNKLDIIEILKKVPQVAHHSLKDPLLKLLDHENDQVKIAAISQLNHVFKEPVYRVHNFIYSKNSELVFAALQYLITQDHIAPQFFENYLDDDDDHIASTALLALAQYASRDSHLGEKYNLHLRIKLFLDEIDENIKEVDLKEKSRLIEAIGYAKYTNYQTIIKTNLNNRNEVIKTSCIKSAGHTKDRYFLQDLFSLLEQPRYRKVASEALVEYGNSLLHFLKVKHSRGTLTKSLLKELPMLLGAINTKKSYKFLIQIASDYTISSNYKCYDKLFNLRQNKKFPRLTGRTAQNLIKKESKRYYKLIRMFYSLKVMSNSDDDITHLPLVNQIKELTIEIEQLIDLQLKVLFNILALRYSPDNIWIAYNGLLSKQTNSQIEAKEYLNEVLHRKLSTQVFNATNSYLKLQEKHFDYTNEIQLYPEKTLIKKSILLDEKLLENKLVKLLHVMPLSQRKRIVLYLENSEKEGVISFLNRFNIDPKEKTA